MLDRKILVALTQTVSPQYAQIPISRPPATAGGHDNRWAVEREIAPAAQPRNVR